MRLIYIIASVVLWSFISLQANAITIKDPSYFSDYMKVSDSVLQTMLTSDQYQVTQHNKTDPAYMSERSYLHNKQEGIYVDIVSGEPLFSSRDKYDSNTGWPAFTKPINDASISRHRDDSDGMIRTEVRSAAADSHLGHIFTDGPSPLWLRYCINSSSLRFISTRHMAELWYGWYLYLFK